MEIEDCPLKKPDIRFWFLVSTSSCELYLGTNTWFQALWDANIKLASQFIK